MVDPTQLPAYIQLRYAENGVFEQIKTDVRAVTNDARAQFDSAFAEVGRTITASVSRAGSQFGRIDLGLGDLRQEAAQARVLAEALDETLGSARRLAAETEDTSDATRRYIQALSAQVIEAREASSAADAQVTTYTRLQTAMDGAIDRTSRLAQAQRDLYAEEAARARQAADAQRFFSQGADDTSYRRSARDSAAVFEEQAYQPRFQNRTGAENIVAGQAAIDRAAISATTLDQVLGRVSVKSREVAQAQQEVAEATARAARAAEDAAREQAQYAASADRLRAELDPMFAAQKRFDDELARADLLLDRNAISQREHAAATQLARDNLRGAAEAIHASNDAARQGTTAYQSVINSQRAMRTASLQAGQQMQDFAISIYSGQRASVVAAQQLPQLAFALSGLEGNANKAYDRIGRFATFLSGPWGLAVGLGVGVLGTLIYNMVATGDAAEEATTRTYDFADGLNVLELSAEQSAEAMSQLVNELRSAMAVQGDFLRQSALVAQQSVSNIESRIEQRQSRIRELQDAPTGGIFGLNISNYQNRSEIADLRAQVAQDEKALRSAREALNAGEIAVTQQRVLESLDPVRAATGEYERAVGELNKARELSREDPITANESGIFISKEGYEAEFERLTRLRDTRIEAAREADRAERPNGRKRRGLSDEDRAARELQRQADFGDLAAERIARINERFDEQPRLIDQAARATRELDAIIAELGDRLQNDKLTPDLADEFRAAQDAARDAQGAIEEALLRPARDMREESERRLEIQELISVGREDEAEIVQALYALEERLGNEEELRRKVQDLITAGRTEEAAVFQRLLDLYPSLKQEVRETVEYEQDRTRELERQRDLLDAQLDVLDTAKRGLQDILSGRSTDLFGDLKQSIDDLRGARLFDKMFGDIFEDLENEIRGKSPLGKASERYARELDEGRPAIGDFTDALKEGARAIRSAANPASVSGNRLPDVPLRAPEILPDGTIVANGQRPANDNDQVELKQLSISELSDRTAAAIVGPMLEGFDEILGTTFTQGLESALTGALSGYLQAGKVGGVLGAAKGIVDFLNVDGGSDLLGGLSAGLGTALGGAGKGGQVDDLLDLLGIKSNNTGAQIGGAIGAVTGIPGGDIIGSVIGGLIGGAFSGNRTANAVVSNGGYTVGGKDKDNYGAADSLGGAVTGAIDKIAEALDATIGDYFVSIGLRGDEYRVNTDGSSLKYKNGAQGFGQDQEAAVRFAILDAINDGAIKGIRDAELRLLKAGKDLDSALQDVLDFRSVFDRLAQYKDPVGYALDQLDAEFERLIDVFERAGASSEEFAQLEELYGIERAKAIEEATERTSDALKRLLDDLTIGDSGLSLRTRQANAEAAYNPLAARVAAGDTTAYDDYAEAARALLDIERQMYGSTQEYFDRLAEVTSLTGTRVATDANVSPLFEDRASPFDSAGKVKDAVDTQTTAVVSQLEAINDNLIRLAQGDGPWARAYASARSNVTRYNNF